MILSESCLASTCHAGPDSYRDGISLIVLLYETPAQRPGWHDCATGHCFHSRLVNWCHAGLDPASLSVNCRHNSTLSCLTCLSRTCLPRALIRGYGNPASLSNHRCQYSTVIPYLRSLSCRDCCCNEALSFRARLIHFSTQSILSHFFELY